MRTNEAMVVGRARCSALALALGRRRRAPTGEQFMPVPELPGRALRRRRHGFFGGFIDYMNLINMRDGGVNGVKLTWDECETEYKLERGVECYERLKAKGPTGASSSTSQHRHRLRDDRPKSTADKVPLITINHGRTDSTDGRVFPYVFPLLNPYSET